MAKINRRGISTTNADSIREKVSRIPDAVGLAAAGCVAWMTCPAHFILIHSLSWQILWALATGYIALSGLTGIVVSVTISAVLRQRLLDWRVAVAIFWLPPLALLLSDVSAWAGVAAIAVGWFGARSGFRSSVQPPREGFGIFRAIHILHSIPRVPSLAALASGAGFEIAGLTLVLGRIVMSAGCWVIGTAVVARLIAAQRPKEAETASPMRALAPLATAVLFTIMGLIPFLEPGGGGPGTRALARQPEQNEKDDQGGIFKGVILLTDPQPYTTLVPPLPFLPKELFRSKRSSPLSVPFYGVYWMFRPPYSQPPPGSFTTHGTPLDAVFRSTGPAPLVMEARQDFGKLIDVSCCSKIQIGIRSADRATTLELVLRNTMTPRQPSMTLGETEVPSALELRQDQNAPAIPMVITFEMPRQPKIRQFDEATIIFNRRRYAKASVKVAIDRFVFVP